VASRASRFAWLALLALLCLRHPPARCRTCSHHATRRYHPVTVGGNTCASEGGKHRKNGGAA